VYTHFCNSLKELSITKLKVVEQKKNSEPKKTKSKKASSKRSRKNDECSSDRSEDSTASSASSQSEKKKNKKNKKSPQRSSSKKRKSTELSSDTDESVKPKKKEKKIKHRHPWTEEEDHALIYTVCGRNGKKPLYNNWARVKECLVTEWKLASIEKLSTKAILHRFGKLMGEKSPYLNKYTPIPYKPDPELQEQDNHDMQDVHDKIEFAKMKERNEIISLLQTYKKREKLGKSEKHDETEEHNMLKSEKDQRQANSLKMKTNNERFMAIFEDTNKMIQAMVASLSSSLQVLAASQVSAPVQMPFASYTPFQMMPNQNAFTAHSVINEALQNTLPKTTTLASPDTSINNNSIIREKKALEED
jgi:hypothetical protein